jgi:hypothetical protein
VKLVIPNSNESRAYDCGGDDFGVKVMLGADAYVVSLKNPSRM